MNSMQCYVLCQCVLGSGLSIPSTSIVAALTEPLDFTDRGRHEHDRPSHRPRLGMDSPTECDSLTESGYSEPSTVIRALELHRAALAPREL